MALTQEIILTTLSLVRAAQRDEGITLDKASAPEDFMAVVLNRTDKAALNNPEVIAYHKALAAGFKSYQTKL